MIGWLKKLFQKKEVCNYGTCQTCIWWKAEEENGITQFKKNKRYCDAYKAFTRPKHSCLLYGEELFEATADATQTEEISLNLNLDIRKSDLIDPRD